MSKGSDTHETRPAGRLLRPRFAAALALSACAALASTPEALAGGDPVKTGNFRLKLSDSFQDQLSRNEVVMKPKAFAIKEGTTDPITGEATLTLKGKLRFRHRDQKVVYKKVTATIGPGGVLKGGRTKLFRLSGGTVVRNGFGANISGVRMKFLHSAARKLNQRLDLDSLHRARAGAVSISEQPKTVEVTSGSVYLVPNSVTTPGAGNLASKLDDHCIPFISGSTAIAPGIKNDSDPANPTYSFPVSGGTISPQGTDGVVDQAGGIQLANRRTGGSPSVPGDCDEPPPGVLLGELQQIDFAYNLLDRYASSHVVITGPVQTSGDHGVGIGSNLDVSNATVSADPDAHAVTVNGIVIRINKGSALFLNQTFLQPPSYDPNVQFASGDLFGTVNLSVTTR